MEIENTASNKSEDGEDGEDGEDIQQGSTFDQEMLKYVPPGPYQHRIDYYDDKDKDHADEEADEVD